MSEAVGVRFARQLEAAAARLGLEGVDAALSLGRRFGLEGMVVRHTGAEHRFGRNRDARVARRFYEEVLLAAADQITTRLHERDVPHFFAKGIALLGRCYRPGDRELADIDLYVRKSERHRARETLASLGYRALPEREQSGPEALRPGVAVRRGGQASELDAVTVDIHWGLEPVDRLLPRSSGPIPGEVWQLLERQEGLPVPTPHHHAALLVHHLVHHDLLHVRGLVDLALLWSRAGEANGASFETTAAELRVLRTGRVLHQVVVRDLGVDAVDGVAPPPTDWRARRLASLLTVERWLAWAARATEREHVAVTPRRIARRVLLIDDARYAARLAKDVLWPPEEFLTWRWPEAGSLGAARARHFRQVVRKVWPA